MRPKDIPPPRIYAASRFDSPAEMPNEAPQGSVAWVDGAPYIYVNGWMCITIPCPSCESERTNFVIRCDDPLGDVWKCESCLHVWLKLEDTKNGSDIG